MHFPVKHAVSKFNKRIKDESMRQEPATKRRRLILKQERAQTQGALEALEGPSYASENTLTVQHRVFPHVTQFAVEEFGGQRRSFMTYVLPKIAMTADAETITGVTVVESPTGRKMFAHGKELPAVDLSKAINDFINWLEETGQSSAIMVAHNGKRFDFPVLMTALMSANLTTQFNDRIAGFVDSLTVLKKVLPKRQSYSQPAIYRDLLNADYNAHDAAADVHALSEVLSAAEVGKQVLEAYSFSPSDVVMKNRHEDTKLHNLPSLRGLITAGVCGVKVAETIAGSGLNLHHLQKIHERGRDEALRNIFSAKNDINGLPRVSVARLCLTE
ncbi:hypothetical protein CAPTEDRAFT_186863 [Capitella teleta]|uniref:Uncharacterized protein n=1 Tax=Capitella teleta TaxID=283909 RepID=R7VEH7_CAPTE|nr:hypothetical protein CAPTEDRAFT_186863 [Capitella teleta]|eukprot:ELU14671.1 hypothetical protein CAPTEDRAFT_186863 [Capitella teleta]